MKQKTYLFFAIEVGLAHISRTLSIAEELHKRGHKTIFALPKRRWLIFKNTPVKFVDIVPYIEYESVDVVKVVKNKQLLNKLIKEELEIIEKVNPDIIFVDTRITSMCSGIISKRKVIFYGNSVAVPGFSYFPKQVLSPLVNFIMRTFSGTITKSFHKSLFKYLLEVTNYYDSSIKLDNLVIDPYYIIPEVEGYLPTKKTSIKKYYVNPSSWRGFNNTIPKWLEKIYPDGKTIYVTFGGTGFDGKKLIDVSTALVKHGYRVVVSTGNIIEENQFPTLNNLFVSKFLPGNEVSKRVDIVVCHGGYGTLNEAIQAKKPVLSIPFNPDQLIQSGRIQDLQLGLTIQHLKTTDLPHLFKLDWDKFQQINSRVTIPEILDSVVKILKNYSYYKKNLINFNKRFHKIDGAIECADIMERLT